MVDEEGEDNRQELDSRLWVVALRRIAGVVAFIVFVLATISVVHEHWRDPDQALIILPGRAGRFEASPPIGSNISAPTSEVCSELRGELAVVVQDLLDARSSLYELSSDAAVKDPSKVHVHDWRSRMFGIKDRLFKMKTCKEFATARMLAIQAWRLLLDDGKRSLAVSSPSDPQEDHHVNWPETEALLSSIRSRLEGAAG